MPVLDGFAVMEELTKDGYDGNGSNDHCDQS